MICFKQEHYDKLGDSGTASIVALIIFVVARDVA
jgi:hypothetical protein